MDKKCRKYLKHAVDIVTIIGGTSSNKVFGIKVIEIENGVNIKDYQPYKNPFENLS